MTKIDYSNFDFERAGYGCYKVKYTTPHRGDYYIAKITDMELIDDTKNADEPATAAWIRLRDAVKIAGAHYSKNGDLIPDSL